MLPHAPNKRCSGLMLTEISVGSLDKINQCLEGVDARLTGVEDAVSQLCNMMIQFMSILEAKEKGHGGKVEGRNGRSEFRKTPSAFTKQYYGSSSLTSLIGKIRSSLQDFVEDSCMTDGSDSTGDGSLQECMTIIDGMANSLQMEQRLDQSTDGRPLVLPPRELLDAAIGIYFDQINWMLPLFDKDTFSENVRRSYELGLDAESAWILCFNGIILITLNIRALGSSKTAQDRESTLADGSVKADLIKQFHGNFRGGLNKRQSLLEPSLINVQALLLMVSRRSFASQRCDYANLRCSLCLRFDSALLLKRIFRADYHPFSSIKLALWLSLLVFISKMRCRRSKARAKRLSETMFSGLFM